MKEIVSASIKQAHLIWAVSIINVSLGFFIPGFDVFTKSISHVALEAPVFAYTHRIADIVIGASMCIFSLGVQLASPSRFSVAMASILLLGVSMICAGVWTLETPLHLLYNLSIFMIIVPLAFSLEFKDSLRAPAFESFSSAVAFLHVFMFWFIYAGFMPQEFNGLIQRLWAIPTMGWFGVAAYMLASRQFSANKTIQPAAGMSAD